jgi:uncharacterized protein (TIGR03437 family)
MRSSILICSILAAVTCYAADLRTGNYRGRKVVFENVDGQAIYQGDIILGPTVEIEASLPAPSTLRGLHPRSSTVASSRLTWPDGKVPYLIDTALSKAQQQVILQAIEHWNTRTSLHLVERTVESNYVRFTSGTSTIACSSSVGVVGGAQQIRLPYPGCGLGQTIHEIGHAVGLWHEQERNDRNRYLTVLYENIDKPSASQYAQVFGDGVDSGPYDYNSIMHYDAFGFSRDGLLPAMETVPAGIPIGQISVLSAGDIEAVQRLYGHPPTRTTLSTTPTGLKLRVDGVLVDDGASFDWSPGSQHTVEAPFQGDDRARYLFGNWSDGGANIHTFQASADHTVLSANFIRQVRVNVAIVPPGSGSVTLDPPSPDGFYTDRTNLFIRATPASGFSFLTWSVTPSRSLNPKWIVLGGAATIQATFTSGQVTNFTSSPVGRLLMIDGSAYSTPANFAWAKGETHRVDIDTTQPNFVHYRFTGWSDGAPQSRTIVASGTAATFTANYVTQHSFSTQVISGNRTGTVAATPSSAGGSGFYDEGTTLQVGASPTGSNAFLGWDGDLSGLKTPESLTMNEQKLVYASFGSQSNLRPFAVVSAATGSSDAIAPGEIVSLYGNAIGPADAVSLQVEGGRVTTKLGGTEVLFDGQPGAIVYASSGQINAVVPYSLGGRSSTSVQVRVNGQATTAVPVPVEDSQPGVFPGAVLNANGSVNSPSNPAPRNSIVVLYATGEGSTNPSVADGQVAATVYPKPVLPVSVRVGGQPAVVHYAGAAPSLVAGVMQINIQIPPTVQAGPKVGVTVVVGDQASPPGVTIAIQ